MKHARKTILKPKDPPVDLDAPITPATLKKWRLGLGYTQKQAAAYLGFSVRTYENWEQGHRPPYFTRTIRTLIEQSKTDKPRGSTWKASEE